MSKSSGLQCCRTFAEYLATDDELFVFRRFKTLDARSISYLQSELLSLEKELHDLDQEDAEDAPSDNNVLLSTKCWEALEAQAPEHPREADRITLIRKIEATLFRYNQALLQQKELMRLSRPEKRPFQALKSEFETQRPFLGASSKLMTRREDFVSLKSCLERDLLTKWVEDAIGWFFKKFRRPDTGGAAVYFSDDVVQRITTFIGIAGAITLLEVGIVGLYFMDNDHIRFGIVALFTLLFAVAIGVFSNARRAEMFGACAAYSAVLVVFLSGNLSSKQDQH